MLANLKHYVANEQELDRQTSSSNLDERTFRELYDLPFEIAVKGSTPASIMCSYNQVNGVYGCETPLLRDVLKAEHGFQGYVMSDFGAVHSTGPALTAGLDQELNRPGSSPLPCSSRRFPLARSPGGHRRGRSTRRSRVHRRRSLRPPAARDARGGRLYPAAQGHRP